jgi:hypothetical protein
VTTITDVAGARERLEEGLSKWLRDDTKVTSLGVTMGDLRTVLAALDEANVDAARYRWLRSQDVETIHGGGVFIGKTPDNLVLNFEHADAAIDQAALTPEPEREDKLTITHELGPDGEVRELGKP